MATTAVVLLSILLLIIAAFLFGIYLIVRKVGNKVADVPSDIVKETFVIIKDKIKEKKNEREEK